jgi:murein DD-endopeptidase MepM/ murein hydrolase activator NlpD
MKFTHNPLKTCKLRTAGLYSVKGAMFGLTRKNKDGSIRAHQGIDLATDEGYRLYAVENSEVVGIAKGLNGYGYTVTLKLNCIDKPELHNKFAFYAHLDRVDVVVGQIITVGYIIGLSGDTGNAKGMTSVDKGGHLHFELRTKQVCGLGLKNRLDPLPFIELI